MLPQFRRLEASGRLLTRCFGNSSALQASPSIAKISEAQIESYVPPITHRHSADIVPRKAHTFPSRHGSERYRRIRAQIVPQGGLQFQLAPEKLVKVEEEQVYTGVRNGDPHRVMRGLLNLVELEGRGSPSAILVTAPPSTFSEILRCIDPRYFVDPYAKVFGEVSHISTHLLGSRHILGDNEYYEFCSAFLSQAVRIMDARQQHWPLSLSDYKYLLKCARSVGHSKAAAEIWKSMVSPPKELNRAAIAPDAEAFNHFIGVKCWQDKMNPKHRYRLRVIRENTGPRMFVDIPVPHSLNSHRIGAPKGIKAQVSNLFRQMVEAGIVGNEETFCLMIIALGRENDVPGIEAILRRVWNIDVDAIMQEQLSDTNRPIPYGRGSPFFPSHHLMYAIAHAYGTNNDISTALRLVDFVSRHYDIPISLSTWDEILQWTSVLAINKKLVRKGAGEVKDTGRETGKLPAEAVSNLWQTMTSEPYNIKPTIQMYDRLITSLLRRQRFGEVQLRLEEARQILKQEINSLGKQEARFLAVSGKLRNNALVEARARDLIFARFRTWRNRKYFKRWLRLLIHRGGQSFKNKDEWYEKNLPDIVKNWLVFLPKQIEYELPLGKVSFHVGSSQMNAWRRRMMRRRSHSEASAMLQYPEVNSTSGGEVHDPGR